MADINIIVAAQTEDARRQLAQLQQQVKNTSNQFGKAKGVHNQYGKQLDKNTRGLSTFAKSGLQQTGYQVGDLAVQLQGGTSFMQAFGQQGSQLLQIFGPVGALLGAGVAIVGALGTVYMKSSGAVKSFSEEVSELNDLVDEGNSLGRTSVEQFGYLAKKYGEVTTSVKNLFMAEKSLLTLKLTDKFVKVQSALTPFTNQLAVANIETRKAGQLGLIFGGSAAAMVDKLGELSTETGLSKDQLEAFNAALPKIMDMKDAAKATDAVSALLKETGLLTTEGMAKLTKEGRENVEMLLQFARAGAVVNTTLNELGQNVTDVKMATSGLGEIFKITEEAGDGLAASISASMGASFKSIINGTKSVKDAFKNMAAAIVDQLIEVLIIQQLVGGVGTATTKGSGLAGFFSGTSGKLRERAIGGPVTTGQTYLVGERGPELFTAGSNGRIIPNDQMQGGGTTVVQNINISTGVSQTVRAEIAQLMPQIANSAKAAVLDAKQRGGSFSKAF